MSRQLTLTNLMSVEEKPEIKTVEVKLGVKQPLPKNEEFVIDLYRLGFSTCEIARLFGVEESAVYLFLKRRIQLRNKSEAVKISFQKPGRREKQSEILKRKFQDPEIRKKRSEIIKSLWRDPEFIKKQNEGVKRVMNDPEHKKRKGEASRRMWRDPEYKKKMSEVVKSCWENPEYIKKMKIFKNTYVERRLQNALKEAGVSFRTHEPILGIPDIFIEPNICVFVDGDYWHSRPEQVERDAYVNEELRRRGYIVLRYWQHEIEDEERLKRIIEEIKKTAEVKGGWEWWG